MSRSKMDFSVKLCFVIILMGLLHEGESLRCYQCISPLKGDCDKPINKNKVTIQTCSDYQNACAHLSVTIDGNTEIRRECADYNYCNHNARIMRQATSISRACSTCSGDLCNAASRYVPAVPIGIAGFMFSKHFI